MQDAQREQWQVGDLTVDVGSQTIMRDAQPIALPQLSFRFLLALVRASPNVLSADALMERVWTGVFVNAETVTQRAKLLRDALGDDPRQPRYFTVRPGSGYQLLPTPVRLDAGNVSPAGAQSDLTSWWKAALAGLFLAILAAGALAAFQRGPFASRSAAPAPRTSSPILEKTISFSRDSAPARCARPLWSMNGAEMATPRWCLTPATGKT